MHHSLHELMGLANGTYRLIHKVALGRRPLRQIALAGGGVERPISNLGLTTERVMG